VLIPQTVGLQAHRNRPASAATDDVGMKTGTNEHTATRADAPFESIRLRLVGAEGAVSHVGTQVGNWVYGSGSIGGRGSIGLLARRYGMAAGAPTAAAPRHRCHGSCSPRTSCSPHTS
jgi:hypothetical protein